MSRPYYTDAEISERERQSERSRREDAEARIKSLEALVRSALPYVTGTKRGTDALAARMRKAVDD